eukprot:324300-Pyramimonas_sp.AAC.1
MRILRKGPLPSLAVHVGGFALNSRGDTIRSCISNLALALAFLIYHLSQLFNLTFSLKRYCIAGPSEQLVKAAQETLVQYAGECDISVTNLGVYYSPGKHNRLRHVKKKSVANGGTSKKLD